MYEIDNKLRLRLCQSIATRIRQIFAFFVQVHGSLVNQNFNLLFYSIIQNIYTNCDLYKQNYNEASSKSV